MTNQASEEVRTKLALILGYERQEQHSSEKTRWYDLDEYGNPIEVTKKVDKVIDLIDQHTKTMCERAKKHGEAVGEYRASETLYGWVTTIWLFIDKDEPKLQMRQRADNLLKDCESLMNKNAKEWKKHIAELQSTIAKSKDKEEQNG